MNAIILAAGRGSRMGELTEQGPKCLIELGGKTLLEWQVQALRYAGVSTITVVSGYSKEKYQHLPYSFLENPRWDKTNMVYTLCCAQSLLRTKPHLISYADIIYHPEIVSALARSASSISITYDEKWESLWRQRFKNPLEDAETFEVSNGKLVTIGGKPVTLSQVKGQYMGLLKITPDGWAQVERVLQGLSSEEVDNLDMTSLLEKLLKQNVYIEGVPIQGRWCEVDRKEDLNLYIKKIKSQGWSHDWRF